MIARFVRWTSVAGGFMLMALAFDYGAGITMPWYWSLVAGVGFGLSVAALGDDS